MEDADGKMDIRELQEDLVKVQLALAAFAHCQHKRLNQQKLESLDKFTCPVENPESPEFSIGLRDCPQPEVISKKNAVKKDLKLLQILAHKIDCPISQIVDKV